MNKIKGSDLPVRSFFYDYFEERVYGIALGDSFVRCLGWR